MSEWSEEDSVFAPVKEGSWWLRCPSDTRWNAHGKSLVGSFIKPKALEDKLEQLKAELGDPPPDLEWGYMKE